MRLGKSQLVIAEILNYICICSHLVQAFGRHGAIDMNAPSTGLVVCGPKAHKTVARHSREKREKKRNPSTHGAATPAIRAESFAATARTIKWRLANVCRFTIALEPWPGD